MIAVLIRIAIFITGFAVLIKTTGKVDTEHFYNLPHYILARFISHAAIIIVLKNTINAANLLIHEKSSLTALNSFILVVMFIAYAIVSLCCIGEGSPLFSLIEHYKNIRKNGPVISYSVFEKMNKLHPDDFMLYSDCLCYKDKPFSLTFIGYLRMLNSWHKQELFKNQNQNFTAVQDIYNTMLNDLQRDLVKRDERQKEALREMKESVQDAQSIREQLNNLQRYSH